MWSLIVSPMNVEAYVKISGQDYKIGTAIADKDSNWNEGVGYFSLTAAIPADAPAGEGALSVKAIANNIYAGSEVSETPTSGAPKKTDSKFTTKSKIVIKSTKKIQKQEPQTKSKISPAKKILAKPVQVKAVKPNKFSR